MTDQDTPPKAKQGFHHRIYPYMDIFVQYANEREGEEPWIVRDRSYALRSQRRGYGKALVRVWTPTDWVEVDE